VRIVGSADVDARSGAGTVIAVSGTRSRSRVRRTWPQRLLISFNVMLIMASLTVAGGLGYLNYRLDQVPRIELGEVLETQSDESEPQNYLIVGTDSAERLDEDDPVTIGRDDIGLNSDTIMLLRVDPQDSTAHLLSFPRDLFVPIPGAGEQRINAAVEAGGPDLLIRTIQEEFNVPVHHYVQIDFKGFKELVDAVDGVPYYFDKPVRDPQSGLDIRRTGCRTLTPDQALAYARARSLEFEEDGFYKVDGSGDLGRISRQQDFIRAAIARAVTKGARNPVTLNSLVDVAVTNVQVDTALKAGDILALGKQFRTFDPDALETTSFEVVDDVVNGAAVLRRDPAKEDINEARLDIFRGGTATSIPMVVQNGSGTPGAAGTTADALEDLGFVVAGTGDADRFDHPRTLVRYIEGHEAEAQYVAQQFSAGADLELVDTIFGADLALVIGQDFGGVSDALQGTPPTPAAAPADPASGDPADHAVTTTTVRGEVPETPENVEC
jgi:LCP family protein required for cell wall assembly